MSGHLNRHVQWMAGRFRNTASWGQGKDYKSDTARRARRRGRTIARFTDRHEPWMDRDDLT